MVTAENITDEQIRALLDDELAHGLIKGAARGAMTSPDALYRFRCRARCAAFINARPCGPLLLCIEGSHEAQCPLASTTQSKPSLAERRKAHGFPELSEDARRENLERNLDATTQSKEGSE